MEMNYVDMCVKCQASLKYQFIERLNDPRVFKDFVGTATLSRFTSGDRNIDLVASVKPTSHTLYFEILDDYKVKSSIYDFPNALKAYRNYIEDNA